VLVPIFARSRRLIDEDKKGIQHTMKSTARKVETPIEPSLKDSELSYCRIFKEAHGQGPEKASVTESAGNPV
jgi:hypothetical protein